MAGADWRQRKELGMFQRLLVPLDGSPQAERALPIAAELARAREGTLILSGLGF